MKQSSRCWDKVFRVHEVNRLPSEHSRDTCIVAIYVDDLIIVTKTPEEMQEVKQLMSSQFQMKDMGELHHCLGIRIDRDKGWKINSLWSEAVSSENAEEVQAWGCQSNVYTSCKDDGVSKDVDSTTYQSMVGSLLYASIATKPYISQAIAVVSKYNSNPSEAYLNAVKRILRYLKGQPGCHPNVQKVWQRQGTWLFWCWLRGWCGWSTLDYWELASHEQRFYQLVQ